MKTSHFMWGMVGLFLGITVGVVVMVLSKNTRPTPIYITPPPPTPLPTSSPTPSPLYVYISGEVQHPDVYELPANSRIQDAIEIAGGFTDQADSNAINLALPLQDNMQVWVPAMSDNVAPASTPNISANNTSAQTLININTATQGELEALPGIGPSLAERIIAYREANGQFSTVTDIMNVVGIGEGRFAQIEPLITVDN